MGPHYPLILVISFLFELLPSLFRVGAGFAHAGNGCSRSGAPYFCGTDFVGPTQICNSPLLFFPPRFLSQDILIGPRNLLLTPPYHGQRGTMEPKSLILYLRFFLAKVPPRDCTFLTGTISSTCLLFTLGPFPLPLSFPVLVLLSFACPPPPPRPGGHGVLSPFAKSPIDASFFCLPPLLLNATTDPLL